MKIISGLEPFIDTDAQILVLGSFPSVISLEHSFYYANKSNRFFKVMEILVGHKLDTEQDNKDALRQLHIALWDVIASCSRKGSLDSNIKDISVNPIADLLDKYRNIRLIICNGKLAHKLYQQNFSSLPTKCICIPSTSAANARMSLLELSRLYQQALDSINSFKN